MIRIVSHKPFFFPSSFWSAAALAPLISQNLVGFVVPTCPAYYLLHQLVSFGNKEEKKEREREKRVKEKRIKKPIFLFLSLSLPSFHWLFKPAKKARERESILRRSGEALTSSLLHFSTSLFSCCLLPSRPHLLCCLLAFWPFAAKTV